MPTLRNKFGSNHRPETGKPVVVSMGDLAASGGYYIACNADKIVAQPTTLTGSIGIFGAIPNLGGTAKNWHSHR